MLDILVKIKGTKTGVARTRGGGRSVVLVFISRRHGVDVVVVYCDNVDTFPMIGAGVGVKISPALNQQTNVVIGLNYGTVRVPSGEIAFKQNFNI